MQSTFDRKLCRRGDYGLIRFVVDGETLLGNFWNQTRLVLLMEDVHVSSGN